MNDASRVDATANGPDADGPSGGRRLRLFGIAAGVAIVSLTLYLVGTFADAPLVRFIGLMIGATTFVPLPADTFVLSASADLSPAVIGIVGGLINATMVLVERVWILALIDSPSFDRMRRFFATNRVVELTDRNMFVALMVGAASFIPFEPFRLIAVMRDYSPVKYFLAAGIARGTRYFVIASVGSALLDVGLLQQAIWLTLALFAVGLVQSALKLVRGTREIDDETVEQPADETDGQPDDKPDDEQDGRQDEGSSDG
jgi:membrane protein YqaA with SNARE-associated domain